MSSIIGLHIPIYRKSNIKSPVEEILSNRDQVHALVPKLNDEDVKIIIDTLAFNLLDKGGDDTKICIFNGAIEIIDKIKLQELQDLNNETSKLYKDLYNTLINRDYGFSIFGFSRQIPETEKEKNISLPPYTTIYGDFIAAHGTVPLKDLDMDIEDTEIFRFDRTVEQSIYKAEELNGKVSIIQFDPRKEIFYGIHNGLGLAKIERSGLFIGLTTAMVTDSQLLEANLNYSSIEIDPNTKIIINQYSSKLYQNDEKETIVSLCSGGMDALLSTTSYLFDKYFSYSMPSNKIEKIDIVYFDWNTRAKNQEIEAVNNFGKYLKELDAEHSNVLQNHIPIDTEIIEANGYFNEILKFSKLSRDDVRLTSAFANGDGIKESEEAISYVPLRNTYLLLALVVKYEQMYPNKKVTFIFGGNLTEGMVYSDNSVNYLNKINQLVKVAGQKTSKFQVIAPYANYTKTNMIKEFKEIIGSEQLEKLINISFSCYFPENGNPCGNCGSCLLREKSLRRTNFII